MYVVAYLDSSGKVKEYSKDASITNADKIAFENSKGNNREWYVFNDRTDFIVSYYINGKVGWYVTADSI